MIGPFSEAVRATIQPCTFLLIVPITVTVLAGRARWRAVAAIVGTAIIGGWLLAANWFLLDGWLLRVSGVVAIAALGGIVAPRRWSNLAPLARTDIQLGLATIATFAATQWWRPCVGDELGTILTAAQQDLSGQLLPMLAYMLGAMLPAVMVALAWRAFDPADRIESISAVSAVVVGIVIAGSIVAGQHDEVVVTLTRWTLE